MRSLIMLAIAFLMLVSPIYNVTVKPVNTDPYFKWQLDLYDNIAVWHEVKEYEEGEVLRADIVIHDLNTGEERIIDKPGVKILPVIYGNYVVYSEEIDGKRENLWLYNIDTGQEKIIKSSILPGWKDIYEDKLVYSEGSRSERDQIYLYNLTTGEERLVLEDENMDCERPRIYKDKIVCVKGFVTIMGDIKEPRLILHNLTTGKEKVITQTSFLGAISVYGNIIAWVEPKENRDAIMCYNIKLGEKRELPVEWALFSAVSVYNNTVVFMGAMNETITGIGGYDLSTNTYFPISILNNVIMDNPCIYKNRVVWVDWRNSPKPQVLTLIQPNEIWMAEIHIK